MDKYDTCDLKSGLRKKFRQETYPYDSNKQNLVKRFNNTTANISWLTEQLVEVRTYYLDIIKELRDIPVNKRDQGIFNDCIETYVDNLSSMRDLWFENNIADETGEWDDEESEEDIEPVCESGDSEDIEEDSENDDYDSEDLVEKVEKDSGYDAYYKGFHNFFIKFEEVIKEKGDLVEHLLLKEKNDMEMDADCNDEIHRVLTNDKVDENADTNDMIDENTDTKNIQNGGENTLLKVMHNKIMNRGHSKGRGIGGFFKAH